MTSYVTTYLYQFNTDGTRVFLTSASMAHYDISGLQSFECIMKLGMNRHNSLSVVYFLSELNWLPLVNVTIGELVVWSAKTATVTDVKMFCIISLQGRSCAFFLIARVWAHGFLNNSTLTVTFWRQDKSRKVRLTYTKVSLRINNNHLRLYHN